MPRAPAPEPPGTPELLPGLIGEATPRPGLTYRLLRVLFRASAFALRFHVSVEGLEQLPRDAGGEPAGGWIAAGLPHRSWIDPFVLWAMLPAEPRLVFFGDARTMARSPLRRWVVRRVGGILPIPTHGGPKAFGIHAAAADVAIRAGAVFCLFPESGAAVPPDRARTIAPGIGYIAVRTGAAVVPVVIGGNHELYLGRRIVLRIGAPMTWSALATVEPDGESDNGSDGASEGAPPSGPAGIDRPAPAPGSHAERELAHRVAAGLHACTVDAVASAFADAEPPPGTKKRWTGLTTLFR